MTDANRERLTRFLQQLPLPLQKRIRAAAISFNSITEDMMNLGPVFDRIHNATTGEQFAAIDDQLRRLSAVWGWDPWIGHAAAAARLFRFKMNRRVSKEQPS